MRHPRKAILLAAGFGTRMRPLSWAVPKPLLPLWNRPLAFRIIDMLASWGVREILVNLHHGANEVFNALRGKVASERTPVRLVFSFEPDILGTGGALRRAEWFIDQDPFWIVNSDIAADLRPDRFLRAMERRDTVGVLWLDGRAGPRTVENSGGLVTTFRSGHAGSPGTATFCGLHLASPAIMRYLPDRPFSSIIEAYEAAMADGLHVRGVEVPRSFWRDLGTPSQYLEAHAAWSEWKRGANAPSLARRLEPGTECRGYNDSTSPCSHGTLCRALPDVDSNVHVLRRQRVGTGQTVPFRAIAPAAVVAPGARVEDSVVMDGAQVLPGATLRNAIVGPGAVVSRPTEGAVVAAALPAADAPPYAQVARAMGWDAARTAVNALAPRGSDRSFSRMVCGRRTAILIEYGTARAENAAYAGHARFLSAHGVHVPGVVLDWPDSRILVMQDAGDVSLESVAAEAGTRRVEEVYREVLDNVLRLHGIPRRAARAVEGRLQPSFGPAVYRWERELFAHHFLGPRLGMDQRAQAGVLADLARVATRLSSAEPVIVHRDLQSSNVYLTGTGPVLIDFQGMRFGPAAYDVASLLCDPYVMLPDSLRDRLLAYYLERTARPGCVERLFWWAAVQRLAQALGAFGRLSALSDTSRFAAYIPPALAMMRRALSHLPAFPHLSAAIDSALHRCS
jgi:NDP-sugar pyrophosphorylase family protein/streptomycin 6-kinase